MITPVDNNTKDLKVAVSPAADATTKKQDDVKFTLAALYFILEKSSLTSGETANIHAKLLSANANAQRELNEESEKLKWNTVPNAIENHHQYTSYKRDGWTWVNTPFGPQKEPKYKKVVHKWTTIQNQGAIDGAMAQNQVVSAKRQILQEKMSVEQQSAQIGQTKINGDCDSMMQILQQASCTLNILKSLTSKALLTQPAQ